jgi:hypothetical protein
VLAVTVTLTIYATLDIEYPRQGFIRLIHTAGQFACAPALSDVTVVASDLPPYSPHDWKFSGASREFTALGSSPRSSSG